MHQDSTPNAAAAHEDHHGHEKATTIIINATPYKVSGMVIS